MCLYVQCTPVHFCVYSAHLCVYSAHLCICVCTVHICAFVYVQCTSVCLCVYSAYLCICLCTVHICVFVCVQCTSAHTHRGHRATPVAFPESIYLFFILFLRLGLSLIWNSLSRQGWLTSEFQESSCLHLPSNGTISTSYHVQ